MLGVGALVLIAGLGFLAFRLFGGGASGTGADSPEAAVEQLISSINERDAVGLAEVFDPDEIEAWIGSFAPAAARLDALETDSSDLSGSLADGYNSLFDSFEYSLTGPDGGEVTYDLAPLDDNGRITRVRIDGLDFEIIGTGAQDVALIGGTQDGLSALDLGEIEESRVEIRDERSGLVGRLFRPGQDVQEEFAPDAHIDIVTVQKDGEWYISIGYSLLEIARNSPDALANRTRPDFGRAYELIDSQEGGAESPEEVVRAFVRAFEESRLRPDDPPNRPGRHPVPARLSATHRR